MARLNGLFLPYENSGHRLFGTCGLPNDIRKLLSDALIDVIRNDKTIRQRMIVVSSSTLAPRLSPIGSLCCLAQR